MDWYQFFPHRCLLCEALCNAYLCDGCQRDLPVTGCACPRCGLPLAIEAVSCGDCLLHPMPFHRTVCAFPYEFPVSQLVHRFKNHNPVAVLDFLGPYLLHAIGEAYTADTLPQALVPVPLHWFTRLQRGFNQSDQMAHWLNRSLRLPVERIIVRRRRTPSQKILRRRERLTNLTGVFSCPAPVPEKHFALIDDVITTGGTVTRIAECLLAAGAARVDVWALARTPRPGFR